MVKGAGLAIWISGARKGETLGDAKTAALRPMWQFATDKVPMGAPPGSTPARAGASDVSGQNLFHNVAVSDRGALGPSIVLVGDAEMVEAENVHNSRVQIVYVDRAIDVAQPDIVGAA